jgi:hypothetical protein
MYELNGSMRSPNAVLKLHQSWIFQKPIFNFIDTVESSIRMIWKGCGRKYLWSILNHFTLISGQDSHLEYRNVMLVVTDTVVVVI